ncbi:MAG: phosphatase PAP2 family protein, partial [Pseudomonadota bacterium]|nr:phosphatase PAP2 family protein [Pseudomonadota bacterium]
FWFAGEGKRRDDRRRVIVSALLGTFIALAMARALATVLPFRVRPMLEIGIGYHAPSASVAMVMGNWSAFPSDTAALFFALAFGIFRLSRPLGIAAMVYSATWICLPRIYLGIHYPSDIAAGALLGTVVVWGTVAALETRSSLLGRRLLTPLFAFERHRPEIFYPASFALLFEIAAMFDDVRALGRAAVHWSHHDASLNSGISTPLLLWGGIVLAAMVAVAWAVIVLGRRFHHAAKFRQGRGSMIGSGKEAPSVDAPPHACHHGTPRQLSR